MKPIKLLDAVVVYSMRPDPDPQRRAVREFWDAHRERRRAFEAWQRKERIRRIRAVIKPLKPIAAVVGAVLVGSALLYLAAFLRGM